MIRVLLSNKGSTTTHKWWWQFVRSVNPVPVSTADQKMEIINDELLNWSAQMWYNVPKSPDARTYSSYQNAYIDFYDEQAYTWLVLRWS
jgi:hypothetical protein